MFLFGSDPAVHALQFLDVINMKDPTQKAHFYRNTLKESLPYVPKVRCTDACEIVKEMSGTLRTICMGNKNEKIPNVSEANR